MDDKAASFVPSTWGLGDEVISVNSESWTVETLDCSFAHVMFGCRRSSLEIVESTSASPMCPKYEVPANRLGESCRGPVVHCRSTYSQWSQPASAQSVQAGVSQSIISYGQQFAGGGGLFRRHHKQQGPPSITPQATGAPQHHALRVQTKDQLKKPGGGAKRRRRTSPHAQSICGTKYFVLRTSSYTTQRGK